MAIKRREKIVRAPKSIRIDERLIDRLAAYSEFTNVDEQEILEEGVRMVTADKEFDVEYAKRKPNASKVQAEPKAKAVSLGA